MRILEIEVFGRGGLAHYVNNLSQALAARGHQVTLITAAQYELEGQTETCSNLRLEKRTARFSGKIRDPSPGFLLRNARRIEAIFDALAVTRLARRLNADVIHFHSTNIIALLYLALFRVLGRPVVYTAHVVTPHEPLRFERAVYRSLYALAHVIVAHSDFDRRRLRDEFSLDPERIVVIPHGDYGFFERLGDLPDKEAARRAWGLEPQHEVALFFGYVRDYKGLDLLFEAWPAVAAARPEARLLIAGDPVQLDPTRRAELEAWATRVGGLHHFEYIPLTEVPRYFVAADLLVMPYRRISQSGVLFLAMAFGLPVIATSVGGLPEILQDGDSALLVPPESISTLADALILALGDPKLRARLAEGGRRVAAEHSWDSIAQRTEGVFDRLAKARG